MREAILPRAAGAVLLAFLLVAVSFVLIAPSAGAADGVPSGSISPFVWEPTPNNGGAAKWSTGQPTGYFEAETAAMVVQIVGEAGNTYVADICLQVEDTAGALEYAFLGFRPWNETHTPPYLPTNSNRIDPSTGTWDDTSDANIWGWNASVNSVTTAGAGHGQCDANYLGLTVDFTVNADPAFLTYGGLLATAGAAVPSGFSHPTVPSGQSAHFVNGTFQSRIEGAGDKTINFKGSEILLPGGASLTVVKQVNEVAPDRDFDFTVTGQDSLVLAGGTSSVPYVFAIPVGSEGVPVTVTETGLDAFGANWAFTSAICKDSAGATVGTVVDVAASVTLNNGDDVTCTFVNTYTPDGSATVVVKKSVAGDSAPAKSFDFSITKEADFQLTGGASSDAFEYVIPVGTEGMQVVVSENGIDALGSGWAFTSVSCSDGDGGVGTSDGASVGFILSGGDAVVCTFTNTYTATTTTTPPVLGSIGNLVWEDRDADGVQDPGEPGVAGVTVELYNADTDVLVATQVTDANGNYLFENLPPGDYYLVFILPASDDEFIPPNVGTDRGLDSDADNLTIIGRTDVITVLGNVIDNTWDAGVAFVAVAGVQITTTTVAVSQETLPFTGAGFGEGGTVGIALAMLALGGMALLTVRRREENAVTVATGWSSRLWDVE